VWGLLLASKQVGNGNSKSLAGFSRVLIRDFYDLTLFVVSISEAYATFCHFVTSDCQFQLTIDSYFGRQTRDSGSLSMGSEMGIL
jgi:hypothetical protein